MTETWASLPGYEGTYEVSDQGQLRTLDRIIVDCNGRRARIAGKAIKVSIGNHGRRHVTLNLGGVQRSRLVSNLVLEAFVGPRPSPDMQACHNDGDKRNDVLSNLRWDTPSANVLDMVKHGTHNNSRKTRCSRGHELSGPNLNVEQWAKTGRRKCLACQSVSKAKARAARAGLAFDARAEAEYFYRKIMRRAAS